MSNSRLMCEYCLDDIPCEVRIAEIGVFSNAIVLYPVLAVNPKDPWKLGQWFWTCCDGYKNLDYKIVPNDISPKEFINVLNDIYREARRNNKCLAYVPSEMQFKYYDIYSFPKEGERKWI